jgi:hypothetical protein
MTKHKEKQKKTGFALLNSVLIAAFFLGGGIIFLLATVGITEMLFLPFFIVNAALGILYGIYRKNGAMKVPVIICRVLAIVMVIVLFGSPIIGANFKDNKVMYPVKRAIFGYGVRAGDDWKKVLPDKLPAECDEYFFRTELCMLAQDYHPYAYLVFRCDEKYFREYINNAEDHGFTKYENEKPFEDFLFESGYAEEDLNDRCIADSVKGKYLNIPGHVLMWLSDEQILELSTETEVYLLGSFGCAFDKESGLMIFWS